MNTTLKAVLISGILATTALGTASAAHAQDPPPPALENVTGNGNGLPLANTPLANTPLAATPLA
ncbi:hypothetical protein GKQ77_31085, partial [Streptomyces sp. BG9H]